MGACLSDTKNGGEIENEDDSENNCSSNANLAPDQLALLQLSLDNSTRVYNSKKRIHKRNESGTVIVINPMENCNINSKTKRDEWDITKRFDQEYKIN